MNRSPIANWPLPLRVLAGLIAPEPSKILDSLARTMAPDAWKVLGDLAINRHRVAPVIAERLETLSSPQALITRVKAEAQANGIETLNQIAELDRIVTQCRSEGVDPVILKGWPLAERLYGTAGNRHARDLDILVPQDTMIRADAALRRLGYTPAPVYELRGQLIGSRALGEECYDLEYQNRERRSSVEMHWRCSHFAGWPEPAERRGGIMTQQTAIGPLKVPTPTADLIYLSGHGGMHAWSRMKWLADIARLATRRGATDLEQDLVEAEEAKAWLPVALALRLAGAVMGSPLPPSLYKPPSAVTALEAKMLRGIADPRIAPGTLRYRLACNLTSLRLAKGPSQMMGVLRYATWRRLRLGVAGLTQRSASG